MLNKHTCDTSSLDGSTKKEICQYILKSCDELNFKLAQVYYCQSTKYSLSIIGLIVVSICLVFTTFGLVTSNFLYPNLDTISKHLKISKRISGLTLLALGNATPDIFSTFNAFKSDSTNLAIGELIGSANFVICFIIGSMGIIKPFKVDRFEFLKDLYIFIFLMVISFYFIYDEKLTNIECFTMILLYFLYVNHSIFNTNDGLIVEVETDVEVDEEDYLSISDNHSQRSISPNQLDYNKLNGLVSLSHHDALKIWNSKSPVDELLVPRFHKVETQPLLAKTHSAPAISFKSPTPVNYFSINHLDNNDDHPTTLSPNPNIKAPIPISIPPPLIVVDQEESIGNDANTDNIKATIFTQLISPYEPEDLYHVSSLLTIPLTVTLNLITPVYSRELLHHSNDDSTIIFKQNLFKLQTVLIPNLFNHLLSFGIPIESLLLSSFIFTICIHYTFKSYPKSSQFIIPIFGFITSVLLIITTSSYLILILKNIGVITKLSESFLGLTVLSFGNSIGDLISNLTLANLELSIVGLNACFGSPLLYILFGIGVNGLIHNLTNDQRHLVLQIDNNFKISSLGLIVMLTLYGVLIPLNKWMIDRKIGALGVCWWVIITSITVYLEL